MTSRQGKLIAFSLFVAVVLAVAAVAGLHQKHASVHVATSEDLTPGPVEAVFTTTVGGTLIFALYPKLAPLHVAQFIRLINAGVYTGATIIRIEKDFVIQIDATYQRPKPLPKTLQDMIIRIPAEFSDVAHRRGTLSMARMADVDSAAASFSVVLAPSPHLDGHYTVFGRMLDESDHTLHDLEGIPVEPGTTKPVHVLPILRAETRARTSH